MTINLSETFANAKNEFINAVNNGEPQERQNELYGDMINQLFEETKLQAKAEAERVSSLPKSAQSLVQTKEVSSWISIKTLTIKKKNFCQKKQLIEFLKI